MKSNPLDVLARVLDDYFVDIIEQDNLFPAPSWEEMGEEHQDNVRNAVRTVLDWLNNNPDSWEELGLGRE